MMHDGKPTSCLVKGNIISGKWGSLASFEKDGSDPESHWAVMPDWTF
jgi:hypothetical protein